MTIITSSLTRVQFCCKFLLTFKFIFHIIIKSRWCLARRCPGMNGLRVGGLLSLCWKGWCMCESRGSRIWRLLVTVGWVEMNAISVTKRKRMFSTWTQSPFKWLKPFEKWSSRNEFVHLHVKEYSTTLRNLVVFWRVSPNHFLILI